VINFQNATLLSYSHRNNFGGGEIFRVGSVKEISVRGFIQVKAKNEDLQGVKEAQLEIQDFIDVANDWEDITINGHNFGKGRVTSINFASNASTFLDNIRFAEFQATIEIPTSTNGDALYNLRGETYRGVLSSIDRTSSALSEFDESFDFNIGEDNTYSYDHSLTVNFISGVQPEMIESGARYDSNKYYFLKNLESDEKYLFTQGASESLRRIDTSANIITSNGEFTPTDTSAIDIAESSRLGSTASSSSYSSSFLPANAIDSSNDTDFVAKTKGSGDDNYQWWEIDLGCNVHDLTKIVIRNRGFAVTINNASGYSTLGSPITMQVDALSADISSGTAIYFSGGGVFTLNSNASAGATSITGNLTTASVANNESGNTVSDAVRLMLNNFRVSVFEEGYTKSQNVTAAVLATSYAKYLTYSSDHYATDNTFPDPTLTISLPAGVFGRYIRVQWLSMDNTGGGTTRTSNSALGFSEFQLYSSRSVVKVYNAAASTNDPVAASVKLTKADPITQSKKAARRIFEARPALGFIDEKYSGYYQVTGKSLFSETYDMSNHTCSFNKSFTTNRETGQNYSVTHSHSLSIGEDGITTITENGNVKGRTVPFFASARTAAETEIANSFSRVTGMFSGYCAGYNNNAYFLPYTSGLNHGPSGFHQDIFDRPTDITRTYNSGEGSVNYAVTYSNNPAITGDFFIERSVSITKETNNDFSVQEDGTITSYKTKRKTPESLKNFYTSTTASSRERCQAELNKYKVGGIGQGVGDYAAASVSTLNLVSSNVNIQAYGKSLTYSKAFTDSKEILSSSDQTSSNMTRMSISYSDALPIFVSTDYNIPNFTHVVNQKGNFTSIGRRTVSCNGFLKRINNKNLIDISYDATGITSEDLPNYEANNSNSLSVMMALKFMRDKCKEKARRVWVNYGINPNDFSEIYVSDASYSFDSVGNISLTMSFDYASKKSPQDLAFRDGGLINKVLNEPS